jgi:hypothetical protein
MKVDDSSRTVQIQRGAARLKVQFLLPETLRFEQAEGFPAATLGKYPPQWHLTAHAENPAARRQFVTVLLPHRQGGEGPLAAARLIEGRNCRAVELRTAGARHVVLFREAGAEGLMEAAGLRSSAVAYAAGYDSEGKPAGTLEAR